MGNSPPKLGGVPSAARRGGSKRRNASSTRHRNHPACSLMLAGTPPNLGGEFLDTNLKANHY
jgi:hypothetical protein